MPPRTSFQHDPARGGARRLQRYSKPIGRQHVSKAIGPFDQTDADAFEVFMHTQVRELADCPQAICVEMIDGQPARVFLDQDKGRAAHYACIRHSKSLGNGPNQEGLARTQGSDQPHNGPRKQHIAKPVTQLRRHFGSLCIYH